MHIKSEEPLHLDYLSKLDSVGITFIGQEDLKVQCVKCGFIYCFYFAKSLTYFP